jgi:hypothetical protein
MTDAPDDTWTPIGRAYALARLADIREKAARALRAGGSAATMDALTNIIRMANLASLIEFPQPRTTTRK